MGEYWPGEQITVSFKFNTVELVEATSNRNAGGKLGINKNLYGTGGRKHRFSPTKQSEETQKGSMLART